MSSDEMTVELDQQNTSVADCPRDDNSVFMAVEHKFNDLFRQAVHRDVERDVIGLVCQIAGACAEEEDEEAGVKRPSAKVIDRTLKVVIEASVLMHLDAHKYHSGTNFPFRCATSDSEGGLRIEWRANDRLVHLVIRAGDGESYIYHQIAGKHAIEKRVTAENLYRWLRIFD
jgi:hypothetical protein